MYSRLARWLILVGFWAFVGFVLSLEVYFNVRVVEPDVSFLDVAIPQYIRALYWAALSPLVLFLRLRVPLKQGAWLGGIAFHVAMSFLVMATFYLARVVFVLPEISKSGQMPGSFWATAQSSFLHRNLIDMAFYWGVIAYGHVTALQQRVKNEEVKAARLESRLIESELHALKQQLHPHFLFNAMNTIAVLVREKKNEDAVLLLARLGALLRMLLESTGVHEVTLRQEMEFLDLYIEVQKARFLDRLTVRVEISPAALEALIPSLLLQPLVENAILHGIAPKNAAGTVELRGEIREGRLYLEVRDDGVGLSLGAESGKKPGIGLSNTRERLERIYGGRAGLVLKSERGRGTIVSVVLPCHP
jgi:two-component system LytT family sensor kinase